jgi:2-amino-4-hydroxy-6-hydroxymethyldihydropteridine diphosphokinase
MKYHTAYISVGSNLGYKLENCKNGIAALTRSGSCIIRDRSRFYRTEPVDFKDQDWFVNAVVKIETVYDPFDLLKETVLIQHQAGRDDDAVRFGPRILDLDILLYDDLVIDALELIIPHPRMHKRRFVLKPLCDIDTNIVHPVLKKNIQSLLDGLNGNEQRILPY